jgi:exopolysaccharide biosynthesis polyprenyl glycosylphosphotransferase
MTKVFVNKETVNQIGREPNMVTQPPGVGRRPFSKQAIRLTLYALIAVLDCGAVFSGFLVAELLRGEAWISPTGLNLGYLVVPIYILFAANKQAYSFTILDNLAESLRRALGALLFTMLFTLLIGFFMQAGPLVSRLAFAGAIMASGVFLLIARIGFHMFATKQHAGQLTDELVIVDDAPFVATGGTQILDARMVGLQPDLRDPRMLHRLASYLQGFDRVVIACPPERQRAWSLLMKGANINGEIILPNADDVGALGLGRFSGVQTLVVAHGPLSLRSRAQKRALDLAFTVPAIIALTPLMLLVALAIKLESKGPVFFKQGRIGRSNAIFSILKFRSMRTEMCDTAGNQSTQRDDKRITRVGAFIRKTSIDELPQLINVLLGDMSLVGPRPHALGSLAGNKLFWEVNEQYWIRHALKPGITGLAQVRGYRGATVEHADLENRLRADLEYADRWSLWLDVTILASTAKVLVHTNAY